MNEATPAQWVADPYGRHQLRYWDGAAWTEHVLDDNRPGRDPLIAAPVNTPPTTDRAGATPWTAGDLGRAAGRPGHARASAALAAPARAGEPAPLMSGKAHAGVGLLTCGLWLLVAPVIYWIRKGSYKHAAVWAGAWALVILIGNLTGGSPTDTVSTAAQAPSSTGTAQGLLGGAMTDTAATPLASTTSSSARPSAAKPTTKATTKPTTRTTAQVPASKPKTTKPRTTTSSRKPPTTKKTTTAAKTDPRYGTCKAAKAAGYGPYYRGQDPEYSWYRDSDGDGVVCE